LAGAKGRAGSAVSDVVAADDGVAVGDGTSGIDMGAGAGSTGAGCVAVTCTDGKTGGTAAAACAGDVGTTGGAALTVISEPESVCSVEIKPGISNFIGIPVCVFSDDVATSGLLFFWLSSIIYFCFLLFLVATFY